MPVPCVLAVGKFECFHLGHRALVSEIMQLVSGGIETQLASALVMFEPHPYRVLVDGGYKPLFTGYEREYLAGGLGVDYLLEYQFSRDFAALKPEEFCRRIFEELRARVVVVGAGYRFGNKRAGTVDTLRQMAKRYGAQVHVVGHHGAGVGEVKTSTSTIRELLGAGKLAEAETLLGYPFFLMGCVTPGRRLGRTLGFPTINLYPPAEKFLPADGAYASRVVLGGQCYNGVTNVGLRPTVEGAGAVRSVETHLFDYEGGELYGEHVRVEFLRFIV